MGVQGRAWAEGGSIVGPDYATSLADPLRASAPSTAVGPAQDLQLSVTMPGATPPGKSVSITLEVISIKGRAGGSPVELALDPIPAPVSAAGISHLAACITSGLILHLRMLCLVLNFVVFQALTAVSVIHVSIDDVSGIHTCGISNTLANWHGCVRRRTAWWACSDSDMLLQASG